MDDGYIITADYEMDGMASQSISQLNYVKSSPISSLFEDIEDHFRKIIRETCLSVYSYEDEEINKN